MANDWSSKEYFLAMTALTEYWDTSKPLLLLSMACLRHGESYADYKILPDPWKENHALQAARDYTEQLHARLLPELAAILNEIHHNHYSNRYWEILIGSWLRTYLAALYDRYTSLRLAYATSSNLQTITLTRDSSVIAATPQEFSAYLLTDIFNLQIYSMILDYFGTETTKIAVDLKAKLRHTKQHTGLPARIKNLFRKAANQVFLKLGKKNKILFTDSGVSFGTLLKLFIKSGFTIVPWTYYGKPPAHFAIDWHKRQQFIKIDITQSDFENCVIQSLPYFIPASFIETHPDICALTENIRLKPAVIFSAMGWHYNESFKRLAARQQEKGTLLVGHQHGGDYGILDYHASEIHETKVTDRYYTWGWDSDEAGVSVRPFFGLKLRETKHKAKKPGQEHYLYGTANGRRYLLRFNYSLTSLLNYFAFQQQFIRALPPQLQQKLRIRLYPSDWGWDRELRWQEMNVNLHFQSPAIPFAKALSECKLYIADHISTTFAESLAINKPTLIVCDPQMWGIRADARPYFDELNYAGIVHHNPQGAANALIEIDRDVSAWWNDPERQQIIRKFRSRFCRAASRGLDEWIKELC